MNCKITGEIFNVIRGLQDEQKVPKDYGTGELLYHSEVAFMEAVDANPDMKVSNLSRCLGITKGAVTQQAARLSEKGLIEIYQQQGNKKEKFYRLTEKGKVVRRGHEEFHQRANQRLCDYFCSLNEHDTALILDFLQHLQNCMPFCEFTCKSIGEETERIMKHD